ncbi:MAG: glycine cleavage system protein H [Gaiellales bacterium]|nr:MAG: glycine cleavage system protein H [Gaiellales bacterium]
MVEIDGCNFPEDDIFYDIESQIWVRFDDDGNITAGMTDIAQHIAGNLLYLKPKKIGTKLDKGKRVAIIESGKYVGPINSPLSGTLIEVNEAVSGDAGLVNRDPYGEGWVFRIKPSKLDQERASLVAGAEAADALRDKLGRESWDCLKD